MRLKVVSVFILFPIFVSYKWFDYECSNIFFPHCNSFASPSSFFFFPFLLLLRPLFFFLSSASPSSFFPFLPSAFHTSFSSLSSDYRLYFFSILLLFLFLLPLFFFFLFLFYLFFVFLFLFSLFLLFFLPRLLHLHVRRRLPPPPSAIKDRGFAVRKKSATVFYVQEKWNAEQKIKQKVKKRQKQITNNPPPPHAQGKCAKQSVTHELSLMT